MNQAEYIAFYNKLKGYAYVCAMELFYDIKEEAIDTAMDKFVDYAVDHEPTMPYCRAIVHNSLVNTYKAGRQESKPLRVMLDKIPGAREREIMDMYSSGIRQRDIASKLGIPRPNVSRAVHKWAIW